MQVYASPAANATTAQGFVAGAGDPTNDWGDEGTMSTSSHTYSGATFLWQKVLYADGAKYGTHTFSPADVDGNFGANTKTATEYWQSHHGLTADGNVGPATLAKADNYLSIEISYGSYGDTVAYTGSAHTIHYDRLAGNHGEYVNYKWDGAGDPCGEATLPADYAAPDFDGSVCD